MCASCSRAGWLPIALTPEDCERELGNIHTAGIEHPFASRVGARSGVWYNAWTDEAGLVHPTHWGEWLR
ncbi:hypothetical protein CO675_17195 [Bradyrhizobium sp. C9]|nr:hypothetical protein CO675_17195 [Bradyrhizobium sp. C9]